MNLRHEGTNMPHANARISPPSYRSSCSRRKARKQTSSIATTWASTTPSPNPFPSGAFARIKAVLRRTGAPEAGQLALAPSSSTQSHRLSLGETISTLVPRSPPRLSCATRNGPSTEQLLDRVWGRAVYVEERTVDVHILRLQVLKPFGVADWVQTVRGVGYRFPPADSAGSR